MGEFAHSTHPNLRGLTDLKFCAPDQVEGADAVFLCLPHGESAKQASAWASRCRWLVDLSADFRLQDLALYRSYYGEDHPSPDFLKEFAYGLPEINREKIAQSAKVSGVGCNATATNLALLPLVRAGLVDWSKPIISDIKVGSSEGGAAATDASHHPERSGAVRPYAPAGHRHEAEVRQMISSQGGPADADLHMTVTSIEMVRGASAAVHVFLNRPCEEKDLWKAFRSVANPEPFVRIAKSAAGIFRAPEPKILAGTNFADLGFALAKGGIKATLFCAIDNLVKGAAGSAIQCLNLMTGQDESSGLGFPGLHP
jgi:N-acetyl-gamma-glutamyl-phosphate/LysW-gamma-L-alpha-aminoadipyl-6-phosphate reductase